MLDCSIALGLRVGASITCHVVKGGGSKGQRGEVPGEIQGALGLLSYLPPLNYPFLTAF